MKNLAGQRFGKLVAMRPVGSNARQSVVWSCTCDCGNVVEVASDQLVRGRVTACDCEPREHSRSKDLAGQRFGRLVVVEKAGTAGGRAQWLCRCDCGRECVANTYMLTSGKKRSCGCLRNWRKEDAARDAEAAAPEFRAWRSGPGADFRTGQRFGHLVVVDQVPTAPGEPATWRCVCDCNRIVRVPASDLASGAATSCGQCSC